MQNAFKFRLQRRRIRYNSFDDILADAERIVQASHVKQLGNWTPGQAFEHLAKSFNSSVKESEATLPLWRRLLAKAAKPILLRYGLPYGFKIEAVNQVAAREFLPSGQIANEDGLQRLREAIQRLSRNKMTAKHNLLGRMSAADWEKMHCRHAELHLRLFIPISNSL